MNRKQRDQNRMNAQRLAEGARHWRLFAHVCENCGERGGHWVQMPQSLESLLAGAEPHGFWTCSKMYGDDGRRLPEHNVWRDADAILAAIVMGVRP